MRFKLMPPLERLQGVLDYDPGSGVFRWKVNRSSNARFGEVAGSLANTGYVFLTLDNSRYLAHRVAWYLQTGNDPSDGIVDHRDGVKSNNSWPNLRLGTQADNQANSKTRSDSFTGLKGVHYYKRVGKWMAGIRVDGRKIHLGYFDSPEPAFEAYQAAALKHHGEFARFD